jgi:putative phosphoesterase
VLIAIVADTHMPRGNRALPQRCLELMRGADLILHAGDFVAESVLQGLEELGPTVVAVHGNMDAAELRAKLPGEIEVEAAGATIGMVHHAGPARGRLERLRASFPGADAVVFAHSHQPLHEHGPDFQIFNPGSPTERRRAPRHTMGMARVQAGAVSFEHIVLE